MKDGVTGAKPGSVLAGVALGAMLSAGFAPSLHLSLCVARAQQGGFPQLSGAHEVSAAVGQAGARFTLKNGWALILPAGLPIGNSRVLGLRVAKQRVTADEIAVGFVPIGPTIEFDGALDASDHPLEASYSAERFRPRAGHKLVLALEQAGFCDPQKPSVKLGSGLCSAWTLIDAEYRDGRCRARIVQSGGHRLQFGSVPPPAPAPDADEAALSAEPLKS